MTHEEGPQAALAKPKEDSLLTKIGNISPLMTNPLTAPGAYGLKKFTGADPSLAGIAHGLSKVVTGPLAFLGNIGEKLGGGDGSMVNGWQDKLEGFWKNNFREDKLGDAIGQALPLVLSGGTAAVTRLPTAGTRLLAALKGLPKATAIGAGLGATSVKEGVKPGEYFDRSWQDAKTGAKWSAGLGIAAPLVSEGAGWVGGKLEAPNIAEFMDKLTRGIFTGKNRGAFAQAEARRKYSASNALMDAIYKPHNENVSKVAANSDGVVSTLDSIIDAAANKFNVKHPETLPYIKSLRDKLVGLSSAGKPPPVAAGLFSSPAEYEEFLKATGRAIPKAPKAASILDLEELYREAGAARRALDANKKPMYDRNTLKEIQEAALAEIRRAGKAAGQPELVDEFLRLQARYQKEHSPHFAKELVKLRDTDRPEDVFGQLSQSPLVRVKPDRAAVMAEYSSPEAMLHQYIETAVTQSHGKPGVLATSLERAKPAIEAVSKKMGVSGSEMIAATEGLIRVARTSKVLGFGANAVIEKATNGGVSQVTSALNPEWTGAGLSFKLLQSAPARNLLILASKLPQNGPAFADIVAKLKAMEAGERETNGKP